MPLLLHIRACVLLPTPSPLHITTFTPHTMPTLSFYLTHGCVLLRAVGTCCARCRFAPLRKTPRDNRVPLIPYGQPFPAPVAAAVTLLRVRLRRIAFSPLPHAICRYICAGLCSRSSLVNGSSPLPLHALFTTRVATAARSFSTATVSCNALARYASLPACLPGSLPFTWHSTRTAAGLPPFGCNAIAYCVAYAALLPAGSTFAALPTAPRLPDTPFTTAHRAFTAPTHLRTALPRTADCLR